MKKTQMLLATLLSSLVSVGAQAAPITYVAYLDGPSEAPPNASPGTGSALAIYDGEVGVQTLTVSAAFTGLIGTTTAAHIHCCTAAAFTGTVGVATPTPTFPGFPAGVTSGAYGPIVFDLKVASSWNPTYITNNGGTPATAEAAFASGLAAGKAYFNIHSTAFPGGEIRGFLVPVPEPTTLGLVALGLAATAFRRRRRV